MTLLSPPRRARACARCRHFEQTGTAPVHAPTSGIYRKIGEQPAGECRAKPPKRDRRTGAALWPEVLAPDWCAAFAPPEKRGRG